MPLNYLQLTNKLLQRVNEPELTSANFNNTYGFTTTAKQIINNAIQEVYSHRRYRWRFLRKEHTETLVVGQQTYDKPEDAVHVDWNSFYLQTDDNIAATKLRNMSLGIYRDSWLRYDNANLYDQEYATPCRVVDSDDNRILISSPPDEAYTMKYTYFHNPGDLVLTTDTTKIPDAFCHVIISKALEETHRFRDNVEMTQLYERTAKQHMKDMWRALGVKAETINVLG